MPAGDLTRAWTSTSAALPHGWTLHGVVLGPRQADPVIRSATWCAWARGPNGERAEGSGEYPEQALRDLAKKLLPLRGDRSG